MSLPPDQKPEHLPHIHMSLKDSVQQRLDSHVIAVLAQNGFRRTLEQYFLGISYPSLHAMDEVSVDQVFSEKRSKTARAALYIHVPFCEAGCSYCHYYKLFGKSEEEVDEYIDTALLELDIYRDTIGDLVIPSLYFGGGTPSYMTAAQIDRFITGIKKRVKLEDDAEISFEMHPNSVTQDRLAVLKKHGVNRISIGFESLSDELLTREHRRHSAADAIAAYEKIRKAGFDNVNIDLIYGLGGQTIRDWEETLVALTRLSPPSVTLYHMRLKYGTSEYVRWKRNPHEFPSEEELLLMHAMGIEHMVYRHGYQQDPVDWFTRDTPHHEYQDINWRKSDETMLLGIGPSAYSYINGWQLYNINSLDEYNKHIQQGSLALWRGEHLIDEEPMRRTVMLGLKLGIDREMFFRTYGVDPYTVFHEEWDRLIALGLIALTENSLSLTYTGTLFADEVGRTFYSAEMKKRMDAIDPARISTVK